MEHYGIGYESLKEENPALIYCALSGFGRTGPYAERGGFDLIAQGMSGLMGITGEMPTADAENPPPVKVGAPMTDITAGILAAMGILAAYIRRLQTGEGQVVDTSLFEAGITHTYWQSAICLATGPTDPDDTCTLAHVHLINQAQHRLWIHSPYFVPSEEVIVALQLATLRGVDVRVLLPSGIDHLMVWLSSYYYSSLPQLRRVRFFRYTRGFLHSKMLLVDNDLVSIGTINFDNRSFRINFEITLMLQEADFITACRTQMEKDFAHSEEDPPDPLALRSPAFRLAARSTRLLAPLL